MAKIYVEDCEKVSVNHIAEGMEKGLYNFMKKKCDNNDCSMELKIVADGEEFVEKINLSKTKCHFGGSRLWYQCPRCFKRVGTLYSHYSNPKPACRICYNLNYKPKERLRGVSGAMFKLIREHNKIELKLEKKGLHKKTIARLADELMEVKRMLNEKTNTLSNDLENEFYNKRQYIRL